MFRKRKNKLNDEWLNLTQSVAEIYYTMHLVDLRNFTFQEYVGQDLRHREPVINNENAIEVFTSIVNHSVKKEFREATLEFTDFQTLAERLKDKKAIAMDVVDVSEGWLRLTFITKEADKNGLPTKVIFTTQRIDDDKKREAELLFKLNNDEFTGVFNRRAYELDLLGLPEIPIEQDFVYASIDINGLKAVNDNKGHAAGDELIKGAAACIKQAVGNYGRVYRTGGDEFVVMFFADEKRLPEIVHDLKTLAVEWRGEQLSELSLSVGYATKKEFQDKTIRELADIADKRMYEDKRTYYANNGIERRAKVPAYIAIGDLYNRILKANLTSDSYSVIKSDDKSCDVTATGTLSECMSKLGRAGLVSAEELTDYLKNTDIDFLRNYFNQGKDLLSLVYRRKAANEYINVIIEMVRAGDYEDDNQSLYLYIKQVDTI